MNLTVDVISGAAKKNADRLTKSINQTTQSTKALNVTVKQASSAFSSFLGNISATAVTAISRSIVSLGGSLIDSTKKLESISTQFEVLTGSAGQANAVVKELTDFTARTPFRLEGVANAGQQLLGFGFEAEKVVPLLEQIGNVAAASGKPINDISLIFGQVSAAGKLTGERLLQLQERAIPIGPAIAKTLGIAETAVKDAVTNGQVDFKTFEKAFQSLSQEGEFAFGGIAKQSQTLQGRISTLQDNFQLLSVNIGSRLTPALKAGASALTGFIQNIQNDKAFQNFLDNGVKLIPEAIKFATDALVFFTNVIAETRQFINNLRAAFNSVAVGVIDVVIAINKAEAGVKRFLGLDTSGIDKQNAVLQELKTTFEEVAVESLAANDEIKKNQTDLTNLIERSSQQIVKSYNDEKAAAEALANAEVETTNKRKETQVQLTEAQRKEIEARKAAALKEQEEIKALQATLDVTNAEAELLKTEQERLLADERIVRLQEQLGTEKALRISAQAEALKDAGKQAKAELLIEQQLAEQKRKIKQSEISFASFSAKEQLSIVDNSFGQLAQAAAVGGKETFEITKAFQTAQAITSGILATQRAYESAPYPFNLINAAAQATIAAGNVARIQSQTPKFEDGGIVGGNSFSGDNVAARVNSGEMILNRQQQSTLFSIANGQQNNESKEIIVNTTVELDGEVVGKSVSRQVADGLVLGEVV